MVIAQIPAASTDQLLAVLLGGAALMVMANQGIVFYRNVSGKSQKRELDQPLKVEAAEHFALAGHEHHQYMTKADCRQSHLDQRVADAERFAHIHHQLDSFILKLDGSLAEHNKLAEGRANALHSRITDLVPSIASVEARLDDHIENHRRLPNG